MVVASARTITSYGAGDVVGRDMTTPVSLARDLATYGAFPTSVWIST